MFVNMIAVFGASAMLNFAGRRTLMMVWTAACAGCLFFQGVAAINEWGYVELGMTMLFVCAFEFGPGPILWLYMGEILEDNAMSVAVFLNWFFVMIVGLFTPTLMKPTVLGSGGTFIMFGAFNVIAVIFIVFFMKETKGLSDAEVKRLYRTDNDSTTDGNYEQVKSNTE